MQGARYPSTLSLQPVALSVILALTSINCRGYWPLRWPRKDLWVPATSSLSPIQLPVSELAASPSRIEQDHVSVAAVLIEPRRTKQIFGTDLVRKGVQPLLLRIHNGNDRAYLFDKAHVNPPAIPAAQAARRTDLHPTITLARYLKWLVFVVPGIIVESIVEPASTFNFPGIEEAAQRPPRSNAQRLTADFLKHEIADEEIGPNGSLEGVLFIHPPRLGSAVRVTLINAHTRQPLVLDIPTPPPVYVERHAYPHPSEKVWNAAVSAATHIKSWRVLSTDKTRGMMLVKKGWTGSSWVAPVQITMTVEQTNERWTQVTLQSPLRRATSVGYGEHSATIDKFFAGLDGLFPRPSPRRRRARTRQRTLPAQPAAPPTSTGEEGAQAAPAPPSSEATHDEQSPNPR